MKKSAPHELDAMVMAPALPNMRAMGVHSLNNNPPPSKSKVDVGYAEGLTKVDLSNQEALGIWNMFKNASNPQQVNDLYRQYKSSEHCNLSKNELRRMRDVMISDFRDKN
jgi:hypothetical protein